MDEELKKKISALMVDTGKAHHEAFLATDGADLLRLAPVEPRGVDQLRDRRFTDPTHLLRRLRTLEEPVRRGVGHLVLGAQRDDAADQDPERALPITTSV